MSFSQQVLGVSIAEMKMVSMPYSYFYLVFGIRSQTSFPYPNSCILAMTAARSPSMDLWGGFGTYGLIVQGKLLLVGLLDNLDYFSYSTL